jgi:hypothetical protein
MPVCRLHIRRRNICVAVYRLTLHIVSELAQLARHIEVETRPRQPQDMSRLNSKVCPVIHVHQSDSQPSN